MQTLTVKGGYVMLWVWYHYDYQHVWGEESSLLVNTLFAHDCICVIRAGGEIIAAVSPLPP